MSSVETFTELDVDERRDLLDRVEAIEGGASVRVRYDSSRSTEVQEVEGTALPRDETPLYVRTDDLEGDLFVDVWKIESKHHPGIVAKSTGGRTSRRQPRLGELLDVTVLTDDPEHGDRVRVVDVGDRDDDVAALEGETGEVRCVGNGGSTYRRAEVAFDDVDERRWLPIDRLVLVEEGGRDD